MKLIVDSGATKAAWVFLNDRMQVKKLTTEGISPYHTPTERIHELISEAVAQSRKEVSEIYFYGAGCAEEENKKMIVRAFENAFQPKKVFIEVYSDTLAAARALCGNQEGIACILGTGSNACRYDGEKIAENIRGFGFILGDYGSGAVLGRKLLSDWLYRKMPENLEKSFQSAYGINIANVLDNVYRKPNPSRFLASFVPFLHAHSSEKYIRELLENHFREFLDLMVKPLLISERDLPVHFTGSVAFFFHDTIKTLAAETGIITGTFLKDPMKGLIDYHQ